MFDTLIVFLQECFEKVNFEKMSSDDKNHEALSIIQRVKKILKPMIVWHWLQRQPAKYTITRAYTAYMHKYRQTKIQTKGYGTYR